MGKLDARKLYTYEFAVRVDGRWLTMRRAENRFSRDPESIARGLLEQWIVNQDRPPGGRLVVCGQRRTDRCRAGLHDASAAVRVRVFRGGLDDHVPMPVAAAYLAYVDREPVRERSRLCAA